MEDVQRCTGTERTCSFCKGGCGGSTQGISWPSSNILKTRDLNSRVTLPNTSRSELPLASIPARFATLPKTVASLFLRTYTIQANTGTWGLESPVIPSDFGLSEFGCIFILALGFPEPVSLHTYGDCIIDKKQHSQKTEKQCLQRNHQLLSCAPFSQQLWRKCGTAKALRFTFGVSQKTGRRLVIVHAED